MNLGYTPEILISIPRYWFSQINRNPVAGKGAYDNLEGRRRPGRRWAIPPLLSLADAKSKIEAWRIDDNHQRPEGKLLTLLPFVGRSELGMRGFCGRPCLTL